MSTINWRQLTATYAGGESCNLGELLDNACRGRDTIGGIVLDETGKIIEWQEVFVSADGEDPDCDTPRCPVDWTGLTEAVANARAVEQSLSDAN